MQLIQKPHILQAWSPLSLQARCTLIQQRLGHKVSFSWLRYLYQKLDIRYRVPQRVLIGNRDRNDQLEIERRQFTLWLANAIADGKHIIYMDETSFRLTDRQTKAWCRKDERVVLPLPGQQKSLTLIGALGLCLTDIFVGRIYDKTNGANFQDLMRVVLSKFKAGVVKPILILDNHSAHRRRDIRDWLNHHFEVHFMPVSSCQFNSIELLWGLIKRNLRRRLASEFPLLSSEIEQRRVMNEVIDELLPSELNRFVTANRAYLYESLQRIQLNKPLVQRYREEQFLQQNANQN